MLTHDLDPLNDLKDSPPALLGGLAVVWRRKILIVTSVLIGVLCGYVYWTRQPHVYESTAQVLVIKRQPAMSYAGFSQVDEFVSAQAKLIKSPLVISRALSNPKFPRESVKSRNALRQVSRSLSAKVDGNLLMLAYRGSDPRACKTILDSIIDSYELFLNETLRSRSKETLAQINSKVEQLEAQLQAEQLRIQQLEQDVPLFAGPNGQNVVQQRLAALETKRYDLRVRRSELELRLEIVEKEKAKRDEQNKLDKQKEPGEAEKAPPPPETNTDSHANDLARELLPLQLLETKLLEDLAEDHPEVRDVRRRIASTREYYQRLEDSEAPGPASPEAKEDSLARQLQSMRDELTGLKQSEEAMQELVEQERKEAQARSERDVEARKLASSIARTKRIHSGLMDQLQRHNLGKQFGGYSTTVIAPSAIGGQVSPDAMRIFVSATILGLLVGVGLALIADLTDKRFHSLSEIPERLGLPALGEVPYAKPKRGEDGALLLVDYRTSQSDEAEAYRAIRTALLFGEHSSGKLIQITSPQEGDGKTSVVANLGVSVAEAGKKTLLIDADLRNPRLHEVFGLHNEAGLAAILAGESRWDRVSQSTSVPGLDVLACGPTPSNPSELLTSPRLLELFQSVSQVYDQILIDSSALLTASDSQVVAHRVDGVILTIRIGRRDRFSAERALTTMGFLANRVIGAVATNTSGFRRPWQFNPFQTRPLGIAAAPSWRAESGRPHATNPSWDEPDLEETQRGVQELEEMMRELKAEIQTAKASDESRQSRVADPSA